MCRSIYVIKKDKPPILCETVGELSRTGLAFFYPFNSGDRLEISNEDCLCQVSVKALAKTNGYIHLEFPFEDVVYSPEVTDIEKIVQKLGIFGGGELLCP